MPRKTEIKRRKAIAWKEPNRRGKGPTLTTEEVAKRLNLSVERVRRLVLIGPELDGLPAYVAVGAKWEIRKGYHGTRQTMFYPEDIETWDKTHPVSLRSERVSYTDSQKSFVLAEAEKLRQSDGSVMRSVLRHQLAQERPGEGWATKGKYAVIKQILDDAGIRTGEKTPQARPHRQYRMS